MPGCCRPEGETIVAVCTKPEVKCKMSGGQLGVCVKAEGKSSASCTREPCPVELPTAPYTCMAQH